MDTREARLQGLLEVYEEPDSHAGLYNYAKALEDVEAGLLAGFFYKHFCLASNVIGSESKGVLPCLHLASSSPLPWPLAQHVLSIHLCSDTYF